MDPLRYELERWRDYAGSLGFARPEQAEKDYLQEILLFGLCSGKIGPQLVFRGGTAISKIYGSGRFSEDIDFILASPTSELEDYVEVAIRSLNLRYQTDYKKKAYRNMIRYDLKIKGPIYAVAGNEQAKQTVKIDLNTYERPLIPPKQATRIAVYEDLKPYSIITADKQELLADKVKSMIERTRPMARDLYDAWLLVKKYGLKQDMGLIKEKMLKYPKHEGERFSMAELKEKTTEIGKIWDAELSRLMKTVPDYKMVREEFYDSF
jgi:predicted nucleotidyltransferase component of viral defense system